MSTIPELFEKLFYLLSPNFTYVSDLSTAVNKMQDLIAEERNNAVSEYREQYRVDVAAHNVQVHELLVALALSNKNVWQPASVQKIEAVKALRNIAGFGNSNLQQAKEAVEDSRVLAKSQDYYKGWVNTPDCEI